MSGELKRFSMHGSQNPECRSRVRVLQPPPFHAVGHVYASAAGSSISADCQEGVTLGRHAREGSGHAREGSGLKNQIPRARSGGVRSQKSNSTIFWGRLLLLTTLPVGPLCAAPIPSGVDVRCALRLNCSLASLLLCAFALYAPLHSLRAAPLRPRARPRFLFPLPPTDHRSPTPDRCLRDPLV